MVGCYYGAQDVKEMRESMRSGGWVSVNPRFGVKQVNGLTFYRSYWTVVAWKDTKGRLHRAWDGYSVTTLKHLRDAAGVYVDAKTWRDMRVEKLPRHYSEYNGQLYYSRPKPGERFGELVRV